MKEKPKTKSRWRWWRRILIGLAVFATLVALFYTEEDWRGKRAWENYQHELAAKGEKLDWQAFVPPTVPDDENFFCAPIWTNMLNNKIVMNPYHSDGSPDLDVHPKENETGYLGGEGKTSLTDLKVYQASYRHPAHENLLNEFPITPQPQTPAKDVLFALSKFDSAVEELRQASRRPYANVPLNYEDGFGSASTLLPVLADVKRCTQLLQLRAVAELADGQNVKASDDVKLLLYLGNSLRTSPFLISHLVRMAVIAYDLQPIWEGLAEHKWTDAELVALDAQLRELDFLADYEFAMRGERAFAIASFEIQRRRREVVSLNPNGEHYVTNSLTLMPSAYFYQNEFELARAYQQWGLPLVNTNARGVSPEILRQASAAVDKELKHYSPYTVQTKMFIPATAASAMKTAAIQTSVDLARVAIALERYRLAHGNYPESLGALAPKFITKLPHDLINGEPLHYRLKANGQFILYSVGWNEKDDGGKVVLTKGGGFDRNNGDWVWQYPQK